MKRLKNSKLWIYFALLIMAALFVILSIMGAVAMLLFRNGVISPDEHFLPVPFILLILVSAVMGAVVALFVARKIMRPVEKLSAVLSDVAKGNFSVRLDEKSHFTEIGEMYANFNAMAKELSSIETLRTDFVVSVSHEFKTPIAAIEGYATLLQNDKLDRKTRNEYLDKVINNAHNLSTLTGNILQLSKLENQGVVTDKKIFSLDEQIRQSVLLLEQQWSAKNIEFDLDLPFIQFYGSESLLYQVWYNLIANAIKFSGNNETITINLQELSGEVIVQITDNGCGIDKKEQQHIFDKFYQADKTRASSGNGLGLALVKQIITLCGGTVTVESEIGKGSTFIVKLPKTK